MFWSLVGLVFPPCLNLADIFQMDYKSTIFLLDRVCLKLYFKKG